ncbi:MAG TPA: bifunctional sugar-1-phosphate nucleotidylyltransferase/acetyltransferase [Candidatus Lokiarchaeia archaeon]|nr:bifunctional sugar-1-phosphate nucleotidylyltransferase/acetyltransferase [Candidatus Lokiarchaeia archaeon]
MKSRIPMKAVLLVAGSSEKFFPLDYNRTKHMMPVAGRPLLERSILELKEAGVDEILLVVGFQKEVLKDYFKDGSVLSVKIHYVDQDFSLGKGTGIATSFAKEFVANDPFLLIYGDLQYDAKTIKEIIKVFQDEDVDALLTLSRVDDPSLFGIVEIDASKLVTRIVEKPEPGQSDSNLANAGIYVFKPIIFDAIARTGLSARDEIELTDSVQILVDEGRKVKGFDLAGAWWRDVGRAHDLLDANAHYFTKIKKLIKGNIERNVQIKGEVYIGANTIVRSGTYIEGPVYIGHECEIGPNAYLRPNTYIGDKCRIGNACEIKASIIMTGTKISHLSYVGDSVIGEKVNLGAATIVANLRLDHKEIALREQGGLIPTGLRKLGVLCGDNVNVGCNTNLEPGVRIGANSIIGPNVTISEDIEPDTLVYIKWTDKDFYIKKKIGQSSQEN